MPSLARRALSRVRRTLLRIQPLSATPYASHTPILICIGRTQKIRRVLELGSGPFSTALFLDREVFPDLEVLVSYEDDPEWLPVVQDAVGTDTRLDLRMVDAVRNSVPEDLSGFDLIFIDDSRASVERAQTIAIVRDKHPRAIVVIHDFEQRHYRAAARGFDKRRVVATFTPQVGICYNRDALVDEGALSDALRLVQAERALSPTERDEWARRILNPASRG